MSDIAINGVENPESPSKSLNCTEPQMIENAPNHVSCEPSSEKDTAHIGNDEVYILGEKSIEIEDDEDEEIEEPEIIIDSIVNPLEVEDDTASETSLRAVKLTRSAANESMRQESNDISKPTEFVIVSTVSQSTVKFPDDVQIKDELTEPIATACAPDDEEALENDPMGLLEINDRSDVNSTRSNVEQDADDISSTCSSSIQTTVSTVNISDWAKDYPWLLHEECDEWYGYCLYCDVKLSVRSHKSAKHHGMSLYHQERCSHYLAFREEEEKNNLGTSVAEIKQEFGTDSYVAALKLKRKTQAEAFNNYNWRRWLEECSWLERDSSAGTIGLCKYCSVRLNVEFTYLRQRHQEGAQHKERGKQYAKLNESKSDEVNEENEENEEHEENEDNEGEEEEAATNGSPEAQADAEGDEDEQDTSKSDDVWYSESADNVTARCTLCDIVLKKRNSFKRHVQSQLHAHHLKNHLLATQEKSTNGKDSTPKDDSESTLSKTPTNSWQIYAQLHTWLIADPLDKSYAYCKYCKKRLLYGSSAAKRATHENSYSHKAHEKACHEAQEKDGNKDPAQANEEDESAVDGGDEDGGDEEEAEDAAAANEQEEEDKESEQEEEASAGEGGEEDQEDDADEEDANSEEEEEKEDEEEEKEDEEEDEEDNDQETNADEEESGTGEANKSKRRLISTNTAEWFNQLPWCRRYRKDPKYCFCIYCKIPITKGNRRKHGNSKKHIDAEEKFLKRKNKTETKKGGKEEDLFDWAVDIKAQPSLYYCKCCRVRISKHYSKKQHSISKIHQINEKIYQKRKTAVNPESETKSSQSATPSPQPSQQRSDGPALRKLVVKGQSFISSIKQWQKRHSWLGYKLNELRSNYAYCKACEQSLFVRSFKHVVKHQRSSKHVRIVNQLKRDRQNEANALAQADKKTTKREDDQNTSAPAEEAPTQQENSGELNTSTKDSAKANNYKSAIDTMQKRYSWITKSTRAEHAYCRYCDVDVRLQVIILRNHTNSRAHRRSVVNFGGTKTKTEKKQQDESNAADNEAEEDEDDEARDDVVLLEDNTEEILISEQDDNWTVKSENMDEHEALDCLLQRAGKSGQSGNNANVSRDDRKQATTTDERPSKRFKRSHSFRRLNDSANSSILSSILSTPLTLASCLGPLIQQQIQQVTNLQQSSASTSTTTTPVSSQPPLARITEPENTYDLFFKSISETIKKLPVDIAAEAKVKVMTIICDLELKAIKRQQEQDLTLAREQSNNSIFTSTLMMNASNSNVMVNSPTIGNRTNSNVVTSSPAPLSLTNCVSNEQGSETNGNSNRTTTDNNPTTSTPDQFMGETLITPIYSNANTSPINRQSQQQHYHHQQMQQKQQQTSVSTGSNPSYTAASSSTTTNATMEKNKSPNQAPIIGVMDMNGLQTLQLRNNPIVKQIPKQNNTGQPTGTTTSIRCIPFKNLTQNSSADTNTKITRIQVPMSATSTPTSQSSQNNASSMTNATKGLLNLRSIHITKRTGTAPQQHQQPQTSSPVSVSVVNTIADKNQPTTYVQSSNMQRWTPLNGSINTMTHKKAQQQCTTTTANFQVSAKQQNYTHVNRNYK